MNGVNLNNPELKLVESNSSASVKAVSSSRIQSANAEEPGSSLGASQELKRVPATEEVDLAAAVSHLNDFVQTVQRELQFEVDSEKGQTIVKVVDQSSQKVIRQIPDEVALRLAENLQQDEPLTLFDIKV